MRRTIVGAAMLLALAGCGGGGSTAPSTVATAPTATPTAAPTAVPLDVQSVAANDAVVGMTHATLSLTVADPLDPGQEVFGSLSLVRSASATPTPGPTPTTNPCVTISPLPIVDANHNGIPDNETWTYTNCTHAGPGGSTFTQNGKVNIVDTSSGSTTSWTRTVTNLTYSISGGMVPPLTEVLNGSATHSINSATETISRSFTSVVTAANLAGKIGTFTSSSNETVVFTAAPNSTITPNHAPPNGTITINGTRTVSGQLAGVTLPSATYTTTTPVPLSYVATCLTPPRIVAGQLQMTTTSNGKTNAVTLTFTGCGIPPTIAKS